MERMSVITPQLKRSWAKFAPLLSIQNEQDYDQAVERLNGLIDEVGTDERHPLYSLLDTMGTVIHAYEEQHYPMPECRGG
jgi:HTH-type transcriptional regulator/antitoxin HigA